jgi:hypothetical protein
MVRVSIKIEYSSHHFNKVYKFNYQGYNGLTQKIDLLGQGINQHQNFKPSFQKIIKVQLSSLSMLDTDNKFVMCKEYHHIHDFPFILIVTVKFCLTFLFTSTHKNLDIKSQCPT